MNILAICSALDKTYLALEYENKILTDKKQKYSCKQKIGKIFL